jgi:hypothetical protein
MVARGKPAHDDMAVPGLGPVTIVELPMQVSPFDCPSAEICAAQFYGNHAPAAIHCRLPKMDSAIIQPHHVRSSRNGARQ